MLIYCELLWLEKPNIYYFKMLLVVCSYYKIIKSIKQKLFLLLIFDIHSLLFGHRYTWEIEKLLPQPKTWKWDIWNSNHKKDFMRRYKSTISSVRKAEFVQTLFRLYLFKSPRNNFNYNFCSWQPNSPIMLKIIAIEFLVSSNCGSWLLYKDEETVAQSLSPKTEIWRALTFSLKKKNH